MKKRRDLIKKLNMNYVNVTNKSMADGSLDFPSMRCMIKKFPDYLALYTNPREYHKTDNTCVSFYNFDDTFDGPNGLLNAIKYDDTKRLNEFKDRFRGVKYFISPDISMFGDMQLYRVHFYMGLSREIGIWLSNECGGITIPHIGFTRPEDFKIMLDGYENVNTVAFSTKGKLKNIIEKQLLQEAVTYTVNHLELLENIIVYDASCDNREANEIFSYAKEMGINIIIPDNILKIRNRIKMIRGCAS